MIRKSKLREEIKELRFEISCLHYVTAALCMAKGNPHNALLPIPFDDAEPWAIQAYPRYCKALKEASHRTIEIVVAELQKLEEMFHDDEYCTRCGKWLDPAMSCCPHCLASTLPASD